LIVRFASRAEYDATAALIFFSIDFDESFLLTEMLSVRARSMSLDLLSEIVIWSEVRGYFSNVALAV
jgi:hypothetical protein